ncbi:MAG TPA: hypothetical protein VGM90_06675 [Kofleriaceae bacterium]
MYSPAQSDIDRSRDPAESERAHDDLEVNGAPAAATKSIYIVMAVVFIAMFIAIMAVHAPSGG